jgi:putative intracellular protease/amidase
MRAPLLFVLLLLAGAIGFVPRALAAPGPWVCPPCGLPCDTTSFAGPGTCPACGMKLVEAGSVVAKPDPNQKKVAILVFNGVEILDYCGPYEMFGAAGCEVYTVAATKDPITTAMGMTVVPKYSFTDLPAPDVLVVPGGGVTGAAHHQPTLDFVKAVSDKAPHTLSVCNGAFILAGAGLLDGLEATTTNGNLDRLASQYPKVRVVRDRRYADNGRIVTAAGLSAGIDGALHVIHKMMGLGTAQQVALGEEYHWDPNGGFVRPSMADQQIPKISMDQVGTWNVERTAGDTGHWELVLRGHSDLGADALMGRIEGELTKVEWKKQPGSRPVGGALGSNWSFTGNDGKPWKASLKLEGGPGATREYTAAVTVARAL